MIFRPTLALAAALALAACPQAPSPTPPPGPAGAGGVSVSGAAGAPAEPQGGAAGVAGAGGHGGFVPAGSGGAPAGSTPLCVLPPAPWAGQGPDPQLDQLRKALPGALAGGGYASSLPGWLGYREPRFGAPKPTPGTTLALVPPDGPGWTEHELLVVISLLVDAQSRPLGGHVEAPKAVCQTCGLRNPCGDTPPRLLGIAIDVPDLGAARAKR
jgi:hypothetical protein